MEPVPVTPGLSFEQLSGVPSRASRPCMSPAGSGGSLGPAAPSEQLSPWMGAGNDAVLVPGSGRHWGSCWHCGARQTLGQVWGGQTWGVTPGVPVPAPCSPSPRTLIYLTYFSPVENATLKPAPFKTGFNTDPWLGPGCFTSGAANPSLSSCQPWRVCVLARATLQFKVD